MKRLFYLLSAIALVVGCDKSDDISQPTIDEVIKGEAITAELPKQLYASIADKDEQEGESETRTYVTDGNKIVWHNGDAISYFAGTAHNAKYVTNDDDGEQFTVFEIDETVAPTEGNYVYPSYAVYPYNENITVTGETNKQVIKVNYPATQLCSSDPENEQSFGRGANIMVAKGDINSNDELYFRNACGYLIIKLRSKDVDNLFFKSIKLTALGGQTIAGNANITIGEDGIPSVEMLDDAAKSSTITLDCTNGGANDGIYVKWQDYLELWFALPPVTLSQGIRIETVSVYEYGDKDEQKFSMETSKEITIERNIPQPMATLDFNSNQASDRQLHYTLEGDKNTNADLLTFDANNDNFADALMSGDSNAEILFHYYSGPRNCFVIEFKKPLTAINKEAFKGKGITSVSFPETVTTIGEAAFANNANLTEITIPGSVTTIGNDVFNGCTSLAKVTFLPNANGTPLNIGFSTSGDDDNLFYDENSLTTLYLDRELVHTMSPDNVYDAAFGGLAKLSTVILGSQVKELTPYMFANTAITTLSIPSSVTTISDAAFWGCAQLESLEIPGTVTTIGNNVFRNCSALGTIKFLGGDAVLKIGYDDDGEDENLFNDNTTSLHTLYLDRKLDYTLTGVDTDSEGVFGEIPSLKNVTLGSRVTELTPHMFASTGITSLNIPATVQKIGMSAFDACTSLSTLTFEESDTELILVVQKGNYSPFYESPLTNITYSRNLKYKQMNGTTDFTPADFDEGIFAISKDARDAAVVEGVATVTIGENITSIDPYMFANTLITSLNIPDQVTSIGQSAFYGCNRLATLDFEASDNAITIYAQNDDYSPFYQSPLTNIKYMRNINYLESDGDAYTPNDDDEGIFAISEDVRDAANVSAGSTVIIGEKITEIPYYAFANLPITKLTIPNHVTQIYNDAFYGCTKLAELTLAETSTALKVGFYTPDNKGLFSCCPLAKIDFLRPVEYTYESSSLRRGGVFSFGTDKRPTETVITIGKEVKTIPQYAFSNTAIKSITIPSTVEHIGLGVFDFCEYLNTVNIADGTNDLTIAPSYDCSPFYNSPLTNVYVGRNLVYVNGSNEAYVPDYWHYGLLVISSSRYFHELSVTLSNNVKYISKYMFSKNNITSLVIPASVTEIADYAFYNCTHLASITFEASATPLTIGFQPGLDERGPFYQSPLTTINVYRQLNASEEYKKARDGDDEGIFSTGAEFASGAEAKVDFVDDNNGVLATEISDCMFSGLPIHKIWIPQEIKSIGKRAFYNCTPLGSVTLGHTTPPTLGTDAFVGTKMKPSSGYSIAVGNEAAATAFKSAAGWEEYKDYIHSTGFIN